MYKQMLFVLLSGWLVTGQRPSFAGNKPIGFPELTDAAPSDGLGNRFGEDLPLPLEAKGDRDLVNRISKWPVDKQPFWYINWKALEEQRKNPQTYPQRPNSFSNGPNPENTGGFNTQGGSNSQGGFTSQGGSNSQGNGLTSKFGDSSNSDNQNQNNYHGYRGSRRY